MEAVARFLLPGSTAPQRDLLLVGLVLLLVALPIAALARLVRKALAHGARLIQGGDRIGPSAPP